VGTAVGTGVGTAVDIVGDYPPTSRQDVSEQRGRRHGWLCV